jgi:cell division protein FtsI (penicillin-binding protein 3)
MKKPEAWIIFRIRLVGFVFVVIFLLVTARAFQLQVLGKEEWRKRAERQHQRIIPLTPQRGTIYDSNGEELALSIEVDSLFVEPRKVADPAATARALSAALSLPAASVRNRLEAGKSFQWLKRQVSPRESEIVRALNLPGVGSIREHRRYYPNSEIGAQMVGFTGLDPVGLEGIELRYNSFLLGQGGYLVTERDALGRGLGSGGPVVREGRGGSNLHLTVDRNLQYIAEKELAAGVRSARARAGTIVILDPMTGRVLAMASQPDFNPNAFHNFRPAQWRNRAICDNFEPGSTFKMFLMAAALNEGLVQPEQKVFCEKGSYRVGGRVIHDNKPYEHLSATEILKFSSNIGSAKIGKMLERDRYFRYISNFGFGVPTGIELPGEVSGLVRRPSEWFEIDLAAISFGQGISVTPLQLATAAAAIVNGGYLMAPYLVERIVDSSGQVLEKRGPRVVRQVISENVARQMREMLTAATETNGTGVLAATPGFRVGGKTGTAQKVDPVTGGYSADKRIASFVGFAPAENPRLVILVLVDEPEGQVYGGLVAAPIFSRVAGQSLRYLKVPPTNPGRQEAIPLPAQVTVAALPLAGEPDGEKGPGGLIMPNFSGMSYRQVLQTMERTGVNIKLNGTGRVVEQSPPPGRAIQYGTEVWVRFAAPS